MSDLSTTPKFVRQLVILAGAMLAASLVISGVNAYIALASPPASPYVSDKVGFEGQLADSTGNPVANGSYSVQFSLYSQASGGTAVWSETQTVSVTNGLYSVQLGSVNALPTNAFDGQRWLGVKVGADSEMTPRISISAVPFALNARQAMGLQGFNVSSSAPSNGNALFYDGSNWTPRGATFPDLGAIGNNTSPQNFFTSYRSGAILSYQDLNTVSVSAGQVMIDGYMRGNSSSVGVGFSASGLSLGLDTGTAQSDTPYYIYAVADDSSVSTFQLIVSASSSAPFNKTHYRQLGWFRTSISNTTVQAGSVGNRIENDGRYAPAARVYNTGGFSGGGDVSITFNSERFDNDNIHSTSTNTGRLTAQTRGWYLIYAAVSGWATNYRGDPTALTAEILYTTGGTTVIIATDATGSGGATSTVYYLNVGDYVELKVNLATSGAVYANPNFSPEFGMIKIGD